ncbi:uncharacterized protein EI97DRAFT_380277, partial [Westerdykella ornata]
INCDDDICSEYLWDKRRASYFPGHSKEEVIQMKILREWMCNQENWQTCLNPNCTLHWEEKQSNGFG